VIGLLGYSRAMRAAGIVLIQQNGFAAAKPVHGFAVLLV
jgi:hypothetical protein